MDFHDIVGFTGATIILVAYFALQIEKISAHSLLYSTANVVGSVMIIYTLMHAWNFTAFFIEIVWLAVSVMGMIKCMMSRNPAASEQS